MPERAIDLSKIEESGSVIAGPVIHDGVLYFGGEDSYFYALDAKTGRKLWDLKTGGTIYSTPLINKGAAYFGSFDSYFYAVDVNTHEVIWKIKTGGIIASAPAILGDILFFGSSDSYVYAVSIKNKDIVWKFKTGDEVVGGVVVHNGRAYFGSMDGYFYCVEISGKLLWKFRTGDAIVLGTPLVTEDTVCFGSADNNMYFLTHDGDIKWVVRTGDMVFNNAALYDGILYFGSRDRHLYALDAKRGNVLWKARTDIHIVISRPLKIGNRIYLCSDKFYCFSESGQRIWTSEPCDIIPSGPVFYEGNLYAGCDDCYMRCVSVEDGRVVWKFHTNSSKRIILSKGAIRPPVWNPEFFKEREANFPDLQKPPKEPYGITKLPYGLGPVDINSLPDNKKYAEVTNLYGEINFGASYIHGEQDKKKKDKNLDKFLKGVGM